MASMDLLFRFLGVDAGAGHEFDRMAAKADVTRSALSKFAFGAVAAGGTIAVASIKMASDFQTSMTRIHTQADASTKTVATLSKGILAMAGQVAATPNDLAQAAYHIASFGQKSLTAAQQLQVLKIATEGAKVGGADLVDVTNALDGVLATHVKGVSNYSQAMGALNATVGAGDMTMQDLADALPKVGISAKQAGINLDQMGAALAVFGDNNLRGALAGTSLRMSIQALEEPAKQGVAALDAIGLSSTKLAKDMQQGGLTKALDDLHKHMVAAGDTGKKVGAFLTDAFGKRAGQGLGYLEGELGRFHNKLGEVGKGATGFASSWKGYTKTFGYAWDSATASAESLFITLGTKLLPIATKFMDWVAKDAIPGLEKFGGWLKKNAEWTKPLGIALAAAGAAAMVAFGGPVAIVAGLAAITAGLVYAYKHSQTFREVVSTALIMVKGAFNGLKVAGLAVWHALDAVWHGIDAGVQYVKARFADFAAFWQSHSQEIRQVTRVVWHAIHDVIKTSWQAVMMFIRPALTLLRGAFRTAFDVVKNVVQTTFHVIGAIFKTAERTFLDFVGVVLDLITGHWGRAWTDAKKLVSDAISGIKGILGSFAHGAIHLLEQAGKDIIKGLWNGMKSMFGAVKDGLVGLGKSIISWKGPPAHDKVMLRDNGRLIIQGLIDGMGDKFGGVKHMTELLAKGIVDGWHGTAGRLENALSQPIQNALSKLESVVKSALARQTALVKAAQSKLKSDLSSRRNDIGSLAGTISGGADLSNVFGTDVNGTPTMSNVNSFLSGQVGPLARFAQDLKWAHDHGLNSGLLSQIANLGPGQGELILKQFTSGMASISGANASEALINKYAHAGASTAENALYKGVLARDRAAVHEQTHVLRELTHALHRLEQRAGRDVAQYVTISSDHRGLKLSQEDARAIAKALRELDHRVKITTVKHK